MHRPRPERVVPIEAWVDGHRRVVLAAAHCDQVTVLVDKTVIEIELDVFRAVFLRLLVAAYSAPR